MQRQTTSVQDIKEALTNLLLVKKYNDIRVNDITKKAGVSRGTFYQHFLDKDDLANEIGLETTTKFQEILSGGNLDNYKKVMEVLIEIKKDYKHFKAIYSAQHLNFSKIVQELMENIISKNITLRNRIFRQSDINNPIILKVFSASFERILSVWIEHDFVEPPEKIAEVIMKVEELFWGKTQDK